MFWKKKTLNEEREEIRKCLENHVPPSSLENAPGQWDDFRPGKNVAMKIWLPEVLDEKVRQISDHEYVSRSELIRNTLFVYTYGQHRFLQMKEESDGLFYSDPNPPMYSRSRNRIPELGKNTISFKVWLPGILKEDLQSLAMQAGLTLSHFVREILISHFMGHLELPVRQELLRESGAAAEDWPLEDGQEE